MYKSVHKLVFLLTIFFVLALINQSRAFIQVDGQKFVDSTGTEVFFKGMGLGGWLVPEGYMLHTPGFGSPTQIRELIVDLIGETNADEFYRRYEANYVNEKDIARLAEMGFNSIRLPFNYRMLTPEDQPGVYLESGFAKIDTLVSWCKKYNLWVILDLHCAPGGQNSGNISDSDGTARLWLEQDNKTRTINLWRKIAERYADEELIVGYDLINEPVLPDGVTSVDLKALFVNITKAIREVDTNHIVFIEGNWYATDFYGLNDAWDANLSYSFHKYWSETDKSTIDNMLQLSSDEKRPLWMGESGENSSPWFYEAIKTLEDNNVSWCWWTHKKIDTHTSPYSAVIKEGYQTVLDYWNGNASRPSLEYAKNALFEMADGLALDSCVYLPDVEAALFDPEFGTVSKPYTNLTAPGVVPTAYYDIGTQGVAYNDNDYKKVNWDQDQPWNKGYTFRNDGVDIEPSQDSEGSKYGVGWTENGEWMNYTINVEQSDTFDVIFRIASASGGGSLQLYVDGNAVINSLTVPSTGGWYNWDDLTYEGISLTKGTHIFKLIIKSAGFNINQMKFIAKNTGTGGQTLEIPDGFFLGQNYPNPFNSGTTIPFNLDSITSSSLDIYNSIGQLVRSIEIDSENLESNEVFWDGKDSYAQTVSSGVYFYKLKSKSKSITRKLVYLQ